MRRVKTRYFVEIFIHGLFWLVMYYALQGIFQSSFELIERSANGEMVMRSGQAIFPYAGMVLVFLMLLFYSCAFWLFKKITLFKSGYVRTMVLTGWLLLIYSSNYLLVRRLINMRSHLTVIMEDKPVLPDLPHPPDFATFF